VAVSTATQHEKIGVFTSVPQFVRARGQLAAGSSCIYDIINWQDSTAGPQFLPERVPDSYRREFGFEHSLNQQEFQTAGLGSSHKIRFLPDTSCICWRYHRQKPIRNAGGVWRQNLYDALAETPPATYSTIRCRLAGRWITGFSGPCYAQIQPGAPFTATPYLHMGRCSKKTLLTRR